MRALPIVLTIFLATGCTEGGDPLVVRSRSFNDQPSDDLELAAWSWHDPFGGTDEAIGLRFELRSRAEDVLQDCGLVLDGQYKAPLGELEVYRGFFGGNAPRARSDLRPGETATFAFHHDNNNNLLLVAPDESAYPTESVPTLISISCDGAEATWDVVR